MITEMNALRLKCAFCWKRLATHQIEDSETLTELNICDECYNSIYGNGK